MYDEVQVLEHSRNNGLDVCARDCKFLDCNHQRESREDEHAITHWEVYLQSELHGMAALQEAVCLDSLNRSEPTVDIAIEF